LLIASIGIFSFQLSSQSNVFNYIAVGVPVVFCVIDYYCYRVAFRDYLKSYKRIFIMVNVKPDLIRYLKFKEKLIAEGVYGKTVISEAVKNIEIELLDVSQPSMMKDGMMVFLLTCFVSIAGSFLDFLSIIDRKILLLIVSYFIFKTWLMKSSFLSSYRKKVELKQFLMRLESELVLSGQESEFSKKHEHKVALLQQA